MECKYCKSNMVFVGSRKLDKNALSDIPQNVDTGMEYFCEVCKTHFVCIPFKWEFVRPNEY